MKREFIVEKIGGTSMSQFTEVIHHVFKNHDKTLSTPYSPYGRFVIVSAYAGVTNRLLEDKVTQAPGIYKHFLLHHNMRPHAEALLEHLKSINASLAPVGLELNKANTFIEQRARDLFRILDDLQRILATGYVIKENILMAAREILASIGEVHAAYNTAAILRTHALNAVFVDLSGFKDHRSTSIDQRINRALTKLAPHSSLPIFTGYVKGVEGVMREFNRGYSDMTLAKIATRVHARIAVLYKEFHLSSADPKIVGQTTAVPVGRTNYDVAAQLADVGMEAIHPRVAKLLEACDIPLQIKNTFENDHIGTLITKTYKGEKAKIEIIAGNKHVTLVEVHDPKMVGTSGFDYKLAALLHEHNISYILKTTNANSISQIIWDKDLSTAFTRAAANAFSELTIAKVAIVSIIGTNIAIPGIMARATAALSEANISILCAAQSFRQVNMQFVIKRKYYETAIKALHQNLINPHATSH